jgi:hypothetical protein
MKRMQMWLMTHSTSDPIVKVGNDGFRVTHMGDAKYLVTRTSDATRVGVFSLFDHGKEIKVEDKKPDVERLIAEVARAAKRAMLLH